MIMNSKTENEIIRGSGVADKLLQQMSDYSGVVGRNANHNDIVDQIDKGCCRRSNKPISVSSRNHSRNGSNHQTRIINDIQIQRAQHVQQQSTFKLNNQKIQSKSNSIISQLYKLMERREFKKLVGRSTSGQTIDIKDKKQFVEKLLPLLTQNGNYSSFVKHMKKEGFKLSKKRDGTESFQSKRNRKECNRQNGSDYASSLDDKKSLRMIRTNKGKSKFSLRQAEIDSNKYKDGQLSQDLENFEDEECQIMLKECQKQFQDLNLKAQMILQKESSMSMLLDSVTENLKLLNQESLDCQKQYFEASIKDQQRKIVVIGKLCELIEDHATSTNDLSRETDHVEQIVNIQQPFQGIDSTQLTQKFDLISKDMISQDEKINSDTLSMKEKSDLMNSRLNNSFQDAIEKFTTMQDQGMKVADPQMRQWAGVLLSKKRDDSSHYSDITYSKIKFQEVHETKQHQNICAQSDYMSTIEKFERLQNTSCNQDIPSFYQKSQYECSSDKFSKQNDNQQFTLLAKRRKHQTDIRKREDDYGTQDNRCQAKGVAQMQSIVDESDDDSMGMIDDPRSPMKLNEEMKVDNQSRACLSRGQTMKNIPLGNMEVLPSVTDVLQTNNESLMKEFKKMGQQSQCLRSSETNDVSTISPIKSPNSLRGRQKIIEQIKRQNVDYFSQNQSNKQTDQQQIQQKIIGNSSSQKKEASTRFEIIQNVRERQNQLQHGQTKSQFNRLQLQQVGYKRGMKMDSSDDLHSIQQSVSFGTTTQKPKLDRKKLWDNNDLLENDSSDCSHINSEERMKVNKFFDKFDYNTPNRQSFDEQERHFDKQTRQPIAVVEESLTHSLSSSSSSEKSNFMNQINSQLKIRKKQSPCLTFTNIQQSDFDEDLSPKISRSRLDSIMSGSVLDDMLHSHGPIQDVVVEDI